jgi:hypothetical protein
MVFYGHLGGWQFIGGLGHPYITIYTHKDVSGSPDLCL